jgi:hypothetical protein
MQSYVQRSLIGQAKAGEAADRKSERRYTQASPTAAAQMALSDTLNQSLRARAQTQLQHTLNQRPAVIAQMKLAETLSRRATIQREALPDEEELAQAKFEPAQRQGEALREAEEEETLQGKFESVQREAALDEEERLQGKFDSVQRQPGPDSERPQPREPNHTGLPDNLKTGVEALSGFSLSDVRVHYNSPQPAQLSALAYAQGNDIHVGPGQERHLPHESWHVVQQKQGRVKPTLQMKGVAINDDAGLEREADVMGAKAAPTMITAAGKRSGGANLQPEGVPARPVIQGFWPLATLGIAAVGLAYLHRRPLLGWAHDKIYGSKFAGKEAFAIKQTGKNELVPALPNLLVKQIEETGPDGRQKLLEDLYSHLRTIGVVDPNLKIKIVYDSRLSELAGYTPYMNYLGGELKVSDRAFTSAPLLYSTIRHELIHAEQYRLHQAERDRQFKEWEKGKHDKAWKANESLLPKPLEENQALYQDPDQEKYTGTVQRFLQNGSEMETYAWEILNSDLTGTANVNVKGPKSQQPYLKDRITAFKKFWRQCQDDFKSKHFQNHTGSYRGYYQKLQNLNGKIEKFEENRLT